MLRLFAKDLLSKERELAEINSLVLEKEQGVAGDLLCITLDGAIYEELVNLRLMDDAEEVFSGLVDEQNVTVGKRATTELVARSFGALLIDNEAKPQSFQNPDMKLIFERYIKPFGIDEFCGENRAYKGEFRVSKGMSCYKALEEFCLAVYGVYPRIEGKCLVLSKPEGKIKFSNTDGIAFEKLRLSLLRAKPISCVFVKTREDGDYDTTVKNIEAQKRNILRQRYFNGAVSTGKSIKTVYESLKLSNAQAQSIEISIPQRLSDVLGFESKVVCDGFTSNSGFYVSSLRYSLSKGKESTEIVLKKESNYVDNTVYE